MRSDSSGNNYIRNTGSISSMVLGWWYSIFIHYIDYRCVGGVGVYPLLYRYKKALNFVVSCHEALPLINKAETICEHSLSLTTFSYSTRLLTCSSGFVQIQKIYPSCLFAIISNESSHYRNFETIVVVFVFRIHSSYLSIYLASIVLM